jgi:hypothetical protein
MDGEGECVRPFEVGEKLPEEEEVPSLWWLEVGVGVGREVDAVALVNSGGGRCGVCERRLAICLIDV